MKRRQYFASRITANLSSELTAILCTTVMGFFLHQANLMPCLDGDSQEEQTEGKRMTKFSVLQYTGFVQSLEFLKKS